MLYTVECSFTDPQHEAEWNTFYSDLKLPALISVTGFHTSQRLRAVTPGVPTYFAVHSIDTAEVLASDDYREKGGGNFARWQSMITDWFRNVYDGVERAQAVDAGQYLLVSSAGPASLTALGLMPVALTAVALQCTPARRWMAVAEQSAIAPSALPDDIAVYVPMGPQLRAND